MRITLKRTSPENVVRITSADPPRVSDTPERGGRQAKNTGDA
jgi:hypothetical protein